MKTKIVTYKQKSKKQLFVKENVSPLSAYQPKNDTINWKKKEVIVN